MFDLPTPSLVIDAGKVRRNLKRLADYAASHKLRVRPHTKTHKSVRLARMQVDAGAKGLTVAKAGEAAVMADVCDDIFVAYPTADARRSAALAELAGGHTIRVGLDSAAAADALSAAASARGTTIGVLVDLDVGLHRTGVQSPEAALELARYVDAAKGLRLDGIMLYPGHIGRKPAEQLDLLHAVEATVAETIALWKKAGLDTTIVSGGSTPTMFQSHLVLSVTEIRPGTYIFNDMNTVHGGYVTLDDCAATIVCTVVSDAVPNQVVIDAGSKTLTSDRCGPAPDSGHGYVVEFPQAKIVKLNEEHGYVDVSACNRLPKVGEQVTVIPNHICPCVNLQDNVWWQEGGESPTAIRVDARGKVF